LRALVAMALMRSEGMNEPLGYKGYPSEACDSSGLSGFPESFCFT
jgi:hypothetical protein